MQPGESDLGMGLRGEGYREGYGAVEGYGAGYGRNQPGYAAPAAYGPGGYENVSELRYNICSSISSSSSKTIALSV